MLPPLPKKSLKLMRFALKRRPADMPRGRSAELRVRETPEATQAILGDGYQRGFVRRGRPYQTIRARLHAAVEC